MLAASLFALIAGAMVCGPDAWAGDFVETSGDVLRFAIPAAAFGLTYKHHDQQGRRDFYKSFAANVGATWVLKALVDKERPDGTGDDAFPSGHSSMAFQGAAFINKRYGIRPAIPAYVLAAYTAWTRVDIDEHDTADVLAGAAVGIASSFLLTDRMPGVDITAAYDHGAFGIRISGRF